MLTAVVLNSDASLNNFIEIGSKNFIPGEQFDLVLRLEDPDKDLRHVLAASDTVKFIFRVPSDGTDLEKSATEVDAGDRSMWKVTISEAESADLSAGNVEIKVDVGGVGTQIIKGIAAGVLSKSIIDC